MRRLVVTENSTADGVIDMSGGWFDPLPEDTDQADIAAATAEHSSVADEVAALKDADGRDIVATGSIRLVHELLRLRLVDEIRLFVFPVVVGTGAGLFDAAPKMRLELLKTRPFVSGVVLLRYAVR